MPRKQAKLYGFPQKQCVCVGHVGCLCFLFIIPSRADRRVWKDGEMAVHGPVWATCVRNKEIAFWSKFQCSPAKIIRGKLVALLKLGDSYWKSSYAPWRRNGGSEVGRKPLSRPASTRRTSKRSKKSKASSEDGSADGDGSRLWKNTSDPLMPRPWGKETGNPLISVHK